MDTKSLVNLVQYAIDYGPSFLDAWRDADPSNRPVGVSDRILQGVIDAHVGKTLELPAISRGTDGLWRVDGLAMVFDSQENATTAAEVVARVRASEN